jgi:hypothetical protein|tara:strand:+ start:2310 stop:2555 length:246 start_codon:yes stop_codon:yes gene_type:complete
MVILSNLDIILNDLSAVERDQIVDLFLLAGIQPTVNEQPAKYTYSIEIGLNKANVSALEGIFKYVITHIYKGETNEHSKNK